MAFYFPVAHRQIDWQKGYTFLDQELQAVVQDAELGKRFVDKLVQVNRLSGQEDWIYIHLEVQGSAQAEFAERMFVYNYRIYDRYRRPVASMAVLADDTPGWKPQEFSYEVLGCKHSLQFPVVRNHSPACGEARRGLFWGVHAGAELDLIILKDGRRLGFEIKLTKSPKPSTSMRSA